jgi:hypothetical protein
MDDNQKLKYLKFYMPNMKALVAMANPMMQKKCNWTAKILFLIKLVGCFKLKIFQLINSIKGPCL